MKQRWMRVLALLLAMSLFAVACGSDDDPVADDPVDEPADTADEPADEPDEPADEPADEPDEPADEPADEPDEPADEPADVAAGPELLLGTLLPETGPLAVLGAGMVPSVQLAVADMNAAGANITLSTGDSGTDADIANATVDGHLAEGVQGIVGAASSGTSSSVLDKVTGAQVAQCSPSNTAAGLGTSGDDGFYFRTAPSDDLQAPTLANLVLDDGFANVAIVSRADEYGVGFNQFFVPAFEDGGGTVTYSETYAPETESFDDVVADVVASGPDAVVVVAFDEGFQIVIDMIAAGVGPDAIQIYITDGFATEKFGESIDPENPSIGAGVRGTQPSSAPASGAAFFPAAFAAAAPDTPAIFAAHSYDCAIIFGLAALQADSGVAADWAPLVVDVTRDGTVCNTYADCAGLIAAGEDIDYDGASGQLNFLDVGEPGSGTYDIYEMNADGVLEVLEQVSIGSDAPTAAPPAGPELLLGTLLPETGPLAVLGAGMVPSVQLAVADMNAAGANITLSTGDSGTDADIANATVDGHLAEGVQGIVGAASSGTSSSVLDKVTGAQVAQCSPSNTAAGLGTSGDDGFYFRTAPSDDLQAPTLANLVLDDGFANVAIVSRADEYGVGFNQFFVPAFEDGGGTVTYSETYAPETESFDDVVADVVASGPDAVVVVAFDEGFQIVIDMIAAGVGPDAIQIYITDGFATEKFGESIDPENPSIGAGVRGTQPSSAPASGAAFFPAAFAAAAPDTPAIFAAHSYDCAIIFGLAALQADSGVAADWAPLVVDVTRDGTVCNTYADCAGLIAAGEDIDYDGASGQLNFLDVGEPGSGTYDIYEMNADGVLEVLEQVSIS